MNLLLRLIPVYLSRVWTGLGARLPMDNRMLNFYPHHHPLPPIPPSPQPLYHTWRAARARVYFCDRPAARASARALALASRPAVRLGQTNGPNANGPGPTRLGPNRARANASGLIRPEALEFAPPLDPPRPPPTHHIPNCCPHCGGGGVGWWRDRNYASPEAYGPVGPKVNP